MKHLAKQKLRTISKLIQLQNHTTAYLAFSAVEEGKSLCWDGLSESRHFTAPDRN